MLAVYKDLHCVYNPQSSSRRRRNPELLRNQSVFQQRSPASLSPSPSTAAATGDERTATPDQERAIQTVDFPSVLFLDSKLSRKYHVEIPTAKTALPAYVCSIIGDISHQHGIAQLFFEKVHPWIPIISMKRFHEHINPLCPLRSDYALLILCMDLISWLPGSQIQVPRTTTYLAAKRYYLDLEVAGILSIQCLQAGMLIAIFELGHAIYPSAFLSVAACARYGSALGLDWRTNLSRGDPLSWLDVEEQSRVWWAIALLDRVTNIGQPERRLIVADPGVDALLPRSDIEWDQGIMPSRPPYSVSAPSIKWGDMGPFALTAQATRLLGQVLNHVSQPTDLDQEEAILLDRALRALARVVDVEGQLQDLHMMNQEAICSIALVMLHEAHASLTAKTKTSIHFSASHHVMNCISSVSRSIEALPDHTGYRSVVTCVEEASPFLLTLLYMVACVNARLQKEKQTSESLEAAVVLKSVLGKFDTRWKAAVHLTCQNRRVIFGGTYPRSHLLLQVVRRKSTYRTSFPKKPAVSSITRLAITHNLDLASDIECHPSVVFSKQVKNVVVFVNLP
ncbi:hypothetical protein BP5796_10799 [Coleophoma crateriformis]|uniref:Xylanolytic transcriptional activator regulatory domain-containing protein n=1 Tax=Coleophoma crateriformis TaxID=565419 RepID=A0A3D8QL73_9HELO|nr:hypothetical protein BP5796_10799 [Coleophoma crateriformis]